MSRFPDSYMSAVAENQNKSPDWRNRERVSLYREVYWSAPWWLSACLFSGYRSPLWSLMGKSGQPKDDPHILSKAVHWKKTDNFPHSVLSSSVADRMQRNRKYDRLPLLHFRFPHRLPFFRSLKHYQGNAPEAKFRHGNHRCYRSLNWLPRVFRFPLLFLQHKSMLSSVALFLGKNREEDCPVLPRSVHSPVPPLQISHPWGYLLRQQ